jgi:SNF2 family DNA or RNA helicase
MSPIKNGRAESFKRLQKLVTATCLRRTKKTAGLSLALPQRIEEIDYIQLYPADQNLYDFFKAKTAKIAAGMAPLNEATSGLQTKENKILVLINFLRLICNHGTQLLPGSAVEAWKDQDSAVVDWQLMQNFKKRCDICGEAGEPELLSPSNSYISCMHTLCGTCASANTLNTTEDEKTCPKCVTEPDCGTEATAQSTTLSIPPSAKIQALLKNLESEQTQSERTPGAQSTPEKQTKRYVTRQTLRQCFARLIVISVVFSFWTKMLDMIQEAVMLRGYKFQRIDGRTSLEGRRQALIKFNEDPKCTILLASIGSAGEG